MNYSLMTFSMKGNWVNHEMDAGLLCQIAENCKISALELMDMDIDMYGLEQLKQEMKKHGIICECYMTHAQFYVYRERFRERIIHALEIAAELHARFLMVIPGEQTKEELENTSRMTRQEMLDRAVELYRQAVMLAEPYGIQIIFENTPHYDKPLSAAADCLEVLEQVPGLGFAFDSANFRIADADADELEAYRLLKPYIVRVHVKDAVIGSFEKGERLTDGRRMIAVTAGSGIIPIKEILEKLRDDGYDKTLVIEYARKDGVTGLSNAAWIMPYIRYIDGVWKGRLIQSPCGKIDGIEKPVSRIFFGTCMKPLMQGENAEYLYDAAMSLGINAFDTARGYGKAEESLGRWIKNRNNREKVVVLSKCGNATSDGQVYIDREVILTQLEESLSALQTDYIDIFLLHRDDKTRPVSEYIEVLNELKNAGKIHAFGASNWNHERIAEANRYAAAHGLTGFASSSPNYGLALTITDPWGGDCISISTKDNETALKWYTDTQMPVIAYSSLGRGFFSGRFRSDDYDAARRILDKAAVKGYLCEDNMKRLRRAEILAGKKNVSVAFIAMQYVFSNSMDVYAIVSSLNPDRMMENVSAADSRLTEEEVRYLEGLIDTVE